MQAGRCLSTVLLALLCCSHQALAEGEVVRWDERILALVRELNASVTYLESWVQVSSTDMYVQVT